ncbi:MAG TPA: bifunctional 3,4-dihydroxy-2-butanone-4-phosphate synthase/GTP cyclohydrolase II [Candidatus Atribacteria bacterium]|nr:bifunctional 3,4-dihydroxy-2-butanone-4-phosphate synthase/GTP cyclohydrolase II [Candidatus Atribacteria bacterium]
MSKKFISTIEEAIKDIGQGKMIIVVDDEGRENEGDLVMGAEKVTPEAISFMAAYGRGLICVPITEERAVAMDLPLMVGRSSDNIGTAFTVSVDYKENSTGISAYDRADTVKAITNSTTTASDFRRPGHIFPLIAKKSGVLRRAGHTEAAIDLARLANLNPAGVICEIMKDDGSMARLDDLLKFAQQRNLKIITIEDLIKYRRFREKLVRKTAETILPTDYGEFKLFCYEDIVTGETHLALVKGEMSKEDITLVRVHSECLTGDVFFSQRCDCGQQLRTAMEMIQKTEKGVILYMRQEGRGIGLANKIKAYVLQDAGFDTVEANLKLGFPADLRNYGIGAQILKDLGIEKMNLLTNNPKKVIGLSGYGLKIIDRIPLKICSSRNNVKYLKTKKEKLGHWL